MKLLKASEAMKRLQIGRNKLYRLVGDGQLKHVRIGRAIRISEKHLEEFVQAREANQRV